MFKPAFYLCLLALLPFSVLLTGCGSRQGGSPIAVAANRQGSVRGGQQPVSGATIQLYTVGTSGDGSAATPLLSPAPVTDANGVFDFSGAYHCPTPSSLVYIVATGGNPGLAPGSNNPALGLMAAIGPCSGLSASTFIQINELTTVGSVYALAPYISSLSAIGSAPGEATAIANAFTLASEFVNISTGTAPGAGVPVGTVVPVAQINTIGNIIAACINSAGGSAGDTTACGTLFSLTTPTGLAPATNTITALLHLADYPALNTTALYNLATPTAPFQPSQQIAPPDLGVRLTVPSGFAASPAALDFPATRVGSLTDPEVITFTNNSVAPVGIDIAALQYLISGANPNDFRSASTYNQPNCTTPVQPGASCRLEVTFSPTAIGSRMAYLTISNTSEDPVMSFLLTGDGLEANAGPASLDHTSLSFIASGSPANATLTNSGTNPLSVDGISISNDPTSGQPAFTQTNTCGAALAPQASCIISVSALATTQAYSSGVLTVADDAASGAQTLQLSYSNGFSGPVLFDFGSRSIGTRGSAGISFQPPGYPNTATLTLSGPDVSDFSFLPDSSLQTTTCLRSRSNPFCAATIYFTPSASGLRTATLNTDGNPSGGFIGTGIPAGVHFSASVRAVNFSFVSIGQTSPATTITIVNTGTLPLTLNGPVVTGANPSEFSVVSNCSTLVPSATCSLTVAASPIQPTYRSAVLTLTDSTGVAQQAVSLKVLGSYPPPIANPTSLDFPYTALGTISASQSFTVTAYNNDPVSVILADAQYVPFFLSQGGSCASTPCQIAVAFAPTAINTLPAAGNNSYDQLIITDLLSGQATQVSLSGIWQMPTP